MNKIGFGFLRLPLTDVHDESSIDWPVLEQMVDLFLERGGRYFDTAYTYLGGMSEKALCRSLVKRHPREKFQIADKLPVWLLKEPADCETYFREQLSRCGVEFFDVYLLHWLNEKHYQQAEAADAFGYLQRLKQSGLARQTGFSYHGDAELLERILDAHPEVDIVQLQINYLDWESASIQSRLCYEAAARHGKLVVVMEPVKGGFLSTVPAECETMLREMRPGESMAVWALLFAQTLPAVEVVLSGMSTVAQVADNMQDRDKLSRLEREALGLVRKAIQGQAAIPCTGCRYCVRECPRHIAIPECFRLYNELQRHPGDDWKIRPAYVQLGHRNGVADACLGCHRCEGHCPQKLPISEWLTKVAAALGAH